MCKECEDFQKALGIMTGVGSEKVERVSCTCCGSYRALSDDISEHFRLILIPNKGIIKLCANCQRDYIKNCACCGEEYCSYFVGSHTVHDSRDRQTKEQICNSCMTLLVGSPAGTKTKNGLTLCARSAHLTKIEDCELIGGRFYMAKAYAAQYDICKCCDKLFTSSRKPQYTKQRGACDGCLATVVGQYNHRYVGSYYTLNTSFDSTKNCYVTPEIVKNKPLRYYGVELEVEHNPNKENKVTLYDAVLQSSEAIGKFGFIKRDGSLNCGIEIVSAPATFEAQHVIWDKFFDKFKKGDIFSSEKTCGMHIHVSKNSLTKLQISKMIVFIYSKENNEFIKAVAQRDSNRYSSFAVEKTFGDSIGGSWIESEGKYTALNIINRHTVELRIFKGTLDRHIFLKNLEFTKALIDYCDTGVCSLKDLKSHLGFCAFVQNYSSCYPNLYKFLLKKDYCIFKSKKPIKGKRRNINSKLKRMDSRKALYKVENVVPCESELMNKTYNIFDSRWEMPRSDGARRNIFLEYKKIRESGALVKKKNKTPAEQVIRVDVIEERPIRERANF